MQPRLNHMPSYVASLKVLLHSRQVQCTDWSVQYNRSRSGGQDPLVVWRFSIVLTLPSCRHFRFVDLICSISLLHVFWRFVSFWFCIFSVFAAFCCCMCFVCLWFCIIYVFAAFGHCWPFALVGHSNTLLLMKPIEWHKQKSSKVSGKKEYKCLLQYHLFCSLSS